MEISLDALFKALPRETNKKKNNRLRQRTRREKKHTSNVERHIQHYEWSAVVSILEFVLLRQEQK